MIINELLALQQRLIRRKALHPVMDYEQRSIAFVIDVQPNGRVTTPMVDWRNENEGKGHPYPCPLQDRTSGTLPNLFYDNREYVFAVPPVDDPRKKQKDATKKKERADQRHRAFIERIDLVRQITKAQGKVFPAVEAIRKFFNNQKYLDEFRRSEDFETILESPHTLWIAFRLAGRDEPVFNTPDLESFLVPSNLGVPEVVGTCCITGETGVLGDTHTPIRGVVGAKETGAVLVSFNQGCVDSFGLRGSENGPVLRRVARGYGRGVNHLLRDNDHHIRLDDGSILVWNDTSISTGIVPLIVGERRGVHAAAAHEHAVRDFRILRDRVVLKGEKPRALAGNIYALELKANSARLAATDFYGDAAERIYRNVIFWFKGLEIVQPTPPKNWPEPISPYISIYEILQAMPNLTDEAAGRLKAALFRAAITEEIPDQTVREALLRSFLVSLLDKKGFVLALYRYRLAGLAKLILTHLKGEYSVALDPDNKSVGYNLGRLFALYEKVQQAAITDLSGGILNRMSGAMETPVSEMTSLAKLNAKHLKILKKGPRIYYTQQIDAVFANIDPTLPRALSDEAQFEFAVGYWHQHATLYTKRETPDNEEEMDNAA